jgi:hypothetical protein
VIIKGEVGGYGLLQSDLIAFDGMQRFMREMYVFDDTLVRRLWGTSTAR